MSDMELRVRQRLEELRVEYDKGQRTLRDLETEASNLRATLLRISGAMQALEETLGEDPSATAALPRPDSLS